MRVFRGLLIGEHSRHFRYVVGIGDRKAERLAGACAGQIGGLHPDLKHTHIAVCRDTDEGPRLRIKGQPNRQGRAIGQLGRESQTVADVDVPENLRRHREAKRGVLGGLLGGNGGDRFRRIVGVCHGQIEYLARLSAHQIRNRHTDLQGADIVIARCASKSACLRIQLQPRWQSIAVGKCRRIGQAVADIRIGKGVGGQCVSKGGVFVRHLCGQHHAHHRGIILKTAVDPIQISCNSGSLWV